MSAALVDVPVFRSRAEAFRAEQLPAVVVMPISDQPQLDVGRGIHYTSWSLTVAVEVLLIGGVPTLGIPPDQLADGTVQLIHAAMMSNGRDLDVTGVLAVNPGLTQWEVVNSGDLAGLVRCQYVVDYRTLTGDLSAV